MILALTLDAVTSGNADADFACSDSRFLRAQALDSHSLPSASTFAHAYISESKDLRLLRNFI
jgi:hypothetical protein